MKIYVGHPSQLDYHNELYKPLINSPLWQQHHWYLPHITSNEPSNTKALIESCDLVIAEVSLPSIGLGIELGWANSANIPIVMIYKAGQQISSSLKIICQQMISYNNLDELLMALNKAIYINF